ncbi:hypothetical protein OBBRIDRAFT_790427 [Obba rivulosa]|uniref:C2H2-type domain-containing protein n=1 Tax=Obba rivulosa TaxID=1052685 RepID=A0A8E2DPA5_9APHY|nr:hypothetical protein OBBRIDRAFT_790427 [Obba rivulosa]
MYFDVIDTLNPSFELALEVAACDENAPVPSPFDYLSMKSQFLRSSDPSFYLVQPDAPVYHPGFELSLMLPAIFQHMAADPVLSTSSVPDGNHQAVPPEPATSTTSATEHCSPDSDSRPGPCPSASASPVRRSARLKPQSPDSGYGSCSPSPAVGTSPLPAAQATGVVRNSRSRNLRRPAPYTVPRKDCRTEGAFPGMPSPASPETPARPFVPCRLNGCEEPVESTREAMQKHLAECHAGYFTTLGEQFLCPWEGGCESKTRTKEPRTLTAASAPRHMQIHFEVNTVICPDCGQEVERDDGLKRHRRLRHTAGAAPQETVEDGTETVSGVEEESEDGMEVDTEAEMGEGAVYEDGAD